MSNSNGRKKKDIRHSNMLRPSIEVAKFGGELENRFLDLCESYLRITGNPLVVPKSLDADMLLWRTMMVRHKKVDFRNTEDEFKSLKNIAQWTVDVNNKIRNQEPKTIDWGDAVL